MNCIICNGKINEDDDDFLEAGIDCYVCWLDVYRAKIAELEARLVNEAECIHCGAVTDQTDLRHWETCEEHPARKRIAELEEEVKLAHILIARMRGEG